LACLEPSTAFRNLRDYLQQVIGVTHHIVVGSKWNGASRFRFDDPNCNVTLYEEEAILEYLRVMYRLSDLEISQITRWKSL
jgi:hypothetical protein